MRGNPFLWLMWTVSRRCFRRYWWMMLAALGSLGVLVCRDPEYVAIVASCTPFVGVIISTLAFSSRPAGIHMWDIVATAGLPPKTEVRMRFVAMSVPVVVATIAGLSLALVAHAGWRAKEPYHHPFLDTIFLDLGLSCCAILICSCAASLASCAIHILCEARGVDTPMVAARNGFLLLLPMFTLLAGAWRIAFSRQSLINDLPLASEAHLFLADCVWRLQIVHTLLAAAAYSLVMAGVTALILASASRRLASPTASSTRPRTLPRRPWLVFTAGFHQRTNPLLSLWSDGTILLARWPWWWVGALVGPAAMSLGASSSSPAFELAFSFAVIVTFMRAMVVSACLLNPVGPSSFPLLALSGLDDRQLAVGVVGTTVVALLPEWLITVPFWLAVPGLEPLCLVQPAVLVLSASLAFSAHAITRRMLLVLLLALVAAVAVVPDFVLGTLLSMNPLQYVSLGHPSALGWLHIGALTTVVLLASLLLVSHARGHLRRGGV